jgi:hypothetical protein
MQSFRIAETITVAVVVVDTTVFTVMRLKRSRKNVTETVPRVQAMIQGKVMMGFLPRRRRKKKNAHVQRLSKNCTRMDVTMIVPGIIASVISAWKQRIHIKSKIQSCSSSSSINPRHTNQWPRREWTVGRRRRKRLNVKSCINKAHKQKEDPMPNVSTRCLMQKAQCNLSGTTECSQGSYDCRVRG